MWTGAETVVPQSSGPAAGVCPAEEGEGSVRGGEPLHHLQSGECRGAPGTSRYFPSRRRRQQETFPVGHINIRQDQILFHLFFVSWMAELFLIFKTFE